MYEPDKHHRRSIRLKEYDYSSGGAYFVTICTGDRQCAYGTVEEGKVLLTQRGRIVLQSWLDIPSHHPHVELDEFVIMPNHVHGLVLLAHRATQASPLHGERPHGPGKESLGAVIGSFKSAVTRRINRLRLGAGNNLWQPNYFEHVVRDDWSMCRIREYIITNPERWDVDEENVHGARTDGVEVFLASLARVKRSGKDRDAGVAPTGEQR